MLLFGMFIIVRCPFGCQFANRRVAISFTSVKPITLNLLCCLRPLHDHHRNRYHSPWTTSCGTTLITGYQIFFIVFLGTTWTCTWSKRRSTLRQWWSPLVSIAFSVSSRLRWLLLCPLTSTHCLFTGARGFTIAALRRGSSFSVLCHRKAGLQQDFISYNVSFVGFDLTIGKRIE